MAERDVEVERPRPEVAVLRLNRPASLNALSWNLVEELHAALDGIDRDNRCRVVVLHGAGRAFCAGLDLKDQGNVGELVAGASGPRAGLLAQNRMASLIPRMRRLQQPLIAAVHGVAYGGGLALVLGCDLRVVERGTRICTQFIRVGVSGCDIGVSWLLPRLIGAARAHDLILTARVIEAEEAERIGIFTRLVDAGEALTAAFALADELCDFTPFGVFATKQVMWANLDVPNLEAGIQLENRNQIMAGGSGETVEAARAFFEKRKPRWQT